MRKVRSETGMSKLITTFPKRDDSGYDDYKKRKLNSLEEYKNNKSWEDYEQFSLRLNRDSFYNIDGFYDTGTKKGNNFKVSVSVEYEDIKKAVEILVKQGFFEYLDLPNCSQKILNKNDLGKVNKVAIILYAEGETNERDSKAWSSRLNAIEKAFYEAGVMPRQLVSQESSMSSAATDRKFPNSLYCYYAKDVDSKQSPWDWKNDNYFSDVVINTDQLIESKIAKIDKKDANKDKLELEKLYLKIARITPRGIEKSQFGYIISEDKKTEQLETIHPNNNNQRVTKEKDLYHKANNLNKKLRKPLTILEDDEDIDKVKNDAIKFDSVEETTTEEEKLLDDYSINLDNDYEQFIDFEDDKESEKLDKVPNFQQVIFSELGGEEKPKIYDDNHLKLYRPTIFVDGQNITADSQDKFNFSTKNPKIVENISSFQDYVQKALKEVSQELEVDADEALLFGILAIKHGGVGNKEEQFKKDLELFYKKSGHFDEGNLDDKINKLFNKAAKFSKSFQDKMKEENIFTGNSCPQNMVAMRLKRVSLDQLFECYENSKKEENLQKDSLSEETENFKQQAQDIMDLADVSLNDIFSKNIPNNSLGSIGRSISSSSISSEIDIGRTN